MEIRKAGLKDLDVLLEKRLEFIRDMKNGEVELSEEFKKSTYEFLKEHLANDTLVAWIAEEDDAIISQAVVTYYSVLPMLTNPSGQFGYIQNVYTSPEYRRKGIASLLVKEIIEDARSRNVGRLYLSATDMGKPVYEKLGFELLTQDMVYRLNQ
jgi:ribosomal protein S18 acetylase RimI-like enzyme